jgi:hypothetical protein
MLENKLSESLLSNTPKTLESKIDKTLPLTQEHILRGFRDTLPGDNYLIKVRDTQIFCNAIVYNIETLKTAKATVLYLWSKNREAATSQAIKEAKRLTD